MAVLTGDQVASWKRDGWLLLRRFFDPERLVTARQEMFDLVPTAVEYAATPERYRHLVLTQFSGMRSFPFPGVELSRLCVHEELLSVVGNLLEVDTPLVYQAQLWAKYHGAIAYEQTHHRDYAKNTMMVPSASCAEDFLEAFIYLSDIGPADGPTALVSIMLTRHLPLEPARFSGEEMPFLYENEILALAPRGSVLLYQGNTFHRATELRRPNGARFGLKLAFKKREATWVTYFEGMRLGFEPDWSIFVRNASVRQLEAVGFPKRSDRRWGDSDVISELTLRYDYVPGRKYPNYNPP